MADEIRFYKGKHKVRVLTESKGYWIVEALEDFQDSDEEDRITAVKVGEQKIVPVDELFRERKLLPPIPEHEYELQMERKLKQMVANEEQAESKAEDKKAK